MVNYIVQSEITFILVIIIVVIRNITTVTIIITSMLRKELAQIESQGQLGQLWWIPLSWTMTMIKG